MPRCENHEEFVKIALDHGWEMYEYGIDSTCVVGGKDAKHLALIWLKPCAWDSSQKIPVGCVCCTDLDAELVKWNEELCDVMASRRRRKSLDPKEVLRPEPPDSRPAPLAASPIWLEPYRAR